MTTHSLITLQLLELLSEKSMDREDISEALGPSDALSNAVRGAVDRDEIRNLNSRAGGRYGHYQITDKGRAILRREGRPAEPQALQWHAGLQLQAVWAPARA